MDQFLKFIFLSLAFSLGACKGGSPDDFMGEQRYEVVGLHGTVTHVKTLCNPTTSVCDPQSVEVTIEVGVGGGCDSFLNAEFTVDRSEKQIFVNAQGLRNVTPGLACTAEFKTVVQRLRIVNLLPPFTISYKGTLFISHVQDFSTWYDTQLVE